MGSEELTIQSVTGPLRIADLGRVLMHEHIFISNPGSEFDPAMAVERDALRDIAVERLSELKALGFSTFVDPCPIELGRDVSLMAEISERSGMRIVCATGFYHEERGLPFYWRASSAEEIADLLIREIETGIGGLGIRPGVIKCATSHREVNAIEGKFLAAAAIAHRATGVPILTHTDHGVGGPEQQQFLLDRGVEPHRCLIGHCCENPDPTYHKGIAGKGSYVGFDRIGVAVLQSDDVRADVVAEMVRAGFIQHVMLSQDRICTMRGRRSTPEVEAWVEGLRRKGEWPPPFTYLAREFLPRLKARGISDAEIDSMLIDNPRRYFTGKAPARFEAAGQHRAPATVN